MASSLGFYIVVATLVLAHCNAKHKGEEPEDFNEVRETSCENVASQVRNTAKHSSCRPRSTHVLLKPKPGYEFRPPMISAKRCSGTCVLGFSPMPTRTVQTEFAIQMHPKGDPTAGLKCVFVKVEEHTKCSCMCSKKKEDCNFDQIYVEASCSCRCENREIRKRKCEANSGRLWDDNDCSCTCPRMATKCLTGLKWNSFSCTCESDKY